MLSISISPTPKIEDIGGGDDVDAANIGGGNIEDIGAIIIVIHGINADNSTNNIKDATTNNANIHVNISIIGGINVNIIANP